MKSFNKKKCLIGLIILIGVIVRVFRFGQVPGGLNQDEAFAGYEAYNLYKYRCDSFGYSFPVYLTAWGSGMNALESYLMLPFIALFGLHQWVIRLPQLLIGCLSLIVFYVLLKEMFNEKMAIIGAFLLAVCPWHIMMSRWALEANLAPGFLMIGFTLFYLGLKDRKYMLMSAFVYGLSLYTYATTWEMLPIVLLIQLLYLFWTGEIKIDRYMVGFAVILGLMALPLILFLLVNYGFINEIRTPFLSIPQLVSMRSEDISVYHIADNLKNYIKILIFQNDGYLHSSVKGFGIYYYISIPFMVIGLISTCYEALIKHQKSYVLLLCWIMGGLITAALIKVNINRINFIHIWNLILIVIGIHVCEGWIKSLQWKKRYLTGIYLLYVICFMSFTICYFGSYGKEIEKDFAKGLGKALEYADENSGRIFIEEDIFYSTVLFYTKVDPETYQNTVVYKNYPHSFLEVASFDKYYLHVEEIIEYAAGAYVMKKEHVSPTLLKDYDHIVSDQYVCVLIK